MAFTIWESVSLQALALVLALVALALGLLALVALGVR
jgi:hypothetical protein